MRPLIRNLQVRRGFGDDFMIGTAATEITLPHGGRLFEYLGISGSRKLTFLDGKPTPRQLSYRTSGEYLLAIGVSGGAVLVDPWRTDYTVPHIVVVRFCSTWRDKLGLGLGVTRWLKVSRS